MALQTQTTPQTIEDRIKEITERWFLIDPAYFMTACTHKIEVNENMNCPIACGGGYLYVHPTYYNDKSDKFLEESLKTEIIRILLKHPYQRQLPNPVKMLLASNMTIADNTKFSEIALTKTVDFFKTSNYKKESMEAIYSLIKLPEKPQSSFVCGISGNNNSQNNNNNSEKDNSNNTSKDKNKKQNKSGNGSSSEGKTQQNQSDNNSSDQNKNDSNSDPLKNFDDGCSSTDDAMERTQFWKEDEVYYETINNLIGKIENNPTDKRWGTMPGDIVEEIKKALIPKFDYKSVFRRVRSTIPSAKRSLTRMRPSRRFGYDAMGSKRQCTTKILVAVDTSGSISDKELELALGFIKGFFTTNIESIWAVQWDTKVYPESFKELTKKTVITRGKKTYGRGGTDPSCVFRALQEKGEIGFLRKEKFNLVIFITDGFFCDVSHKFLKTNYNRTKFLFCLNNKKNYEEFKQNKHMAKFGPCSFVDENID